MGLFGWVAKGLDRLAACMFDLFDSMYKLLSQALAMQERVGT
jgi:hypothetical protein